ncbi:AAA family ATPase [Candidatus Uabimicrobium amorphum]|uniref:Replication-associated recombination protein A n=1 Tax=Uabimicrobium amorphum TaxID=2596890 RepID=A0A5S9IK89_UABAM|nr:AAA family ATPase [Candidatus Uabimicrobium amorphum]BBM83393.1 ATPase AAA [Candidatus Uabimicrobium amorphum]
MEDLFSPIDSPKEPLAARMRPQTLDDFYGQQHIVGPGRLLRRAIQADQLSSVIFYGPPGTGKTTLARIIAHNTNAHFIAINAVLAGIKDLREAIKEAQKQRELYHQRTILFIDEVHRWNKAQQDALLPWVENGTIILIGATTENPYFEVIKPLVSRSRLFQLQSLTTDDLRLVINRAISDDKNGYGELRVSIDENALAHFVELCNGDARSMLNALELAVETTEENNEGIIRITMEVAEESIQKRAVLYDKEGDVHYDTISAFIKSLRGSDPDAALYWMARMVYAGEDPRFIFRRMIIFASEDVGMAAPQALSVVMSCAQAFDYIGMPEGRFPLSQAAIYLATAKKCNSTMAFFDALSAVENEQEGKVPNHLKDGNRDAEGFGHGTGYMYPHAYRDHWVAQQYLPDTLQGRVFYEPSNQGYEKQIHDEVLRRREAQLAAALTSSSSPEILTFSGKYLTSQKERWLQRTISQTGQLFATIRDTIFYENLLQRHSCVLDLNAATGLLTWEALRRVPEGGVWSFVYTAEHAKLLQQQSSRLSPIERPVVMHGKWQSFAQSYRENNCEVKYDAIIGRNPFSQGECTAQSVVSLLEYAAQGCHIAIAQTVPRYTPRIYTFVEGKLSKTLYAKVRKAEERIYTNKQDSMVNWDEKTLEKAWANTRNLKIELVKHPMQLYISPEILRGWFQKNNAKERPSYGECLQQHLSEKEWQKVRICIENNLGNKTISWSTTVAYIYAQVNNG